MKNVPNSIWLMLTGLIFCSASSAQPLPPKHLKFFEERIRPILIENCYKCHSEDAKKLKGDLLLDTRDGIRRGGESGDAIVPGSIEESLLLTAISHSDPELKMPKKRLPDSVIADFRKWVEMGAPDPRVPAPALVVKDEVDYEAGRDFWAFKAPVQTPVKLKDTAWPKTQIDRYVRAAQEARNIQPVRDADRRSLIRRVYFDLVGLPPTPEETEAFIANKHPHAYEELVDRLIARPQFGERWGRHWMDVARFAESTGMERNYTFTSAWRYRDYIIQAFNQDKPFDQFIREQIAGDLMASKNADEEQARLIATGFLAIGPKSLNERNKSIFKMNMVDEQIDVTTRAFMGLTVSCARCHDHKFDPISTRDYYSLAGFFTSTATKYGTANGQGNRQPSSLMPLGGENDDEKMALIQAHQKKIQQQQKLLVEKQKALKQFKKPAEMDKNTWMAQRKEMQQELSGFKKRVERLNKEKNQLPQLDMAMGVTDGKAGDTPILVRGDVAKKGPMAQRGFLEVISRGQRPEIAKEESGRTELAEWIASSENPLTARVIVNRTWHHLFGQGIVRTVDNFGETGERPSHPELLDHLALEFMQHGWSMKRLVRDLVMTRTYRLSSEGDDVNAKADPENRTLWQMGHRRLDAESLRDAVLHVSGAIDLTPGKASAAASKKSTNVGRDAKLAEAVNSVDNTRRSVYIPVIRNLLPEIFSTFDFAEPSIIVGRRNITTVPTQALYMMNSPFMLTYSSKLAERVIKEGGDDAAARIDRAYALTLNRPPVSSERESLKAFIQGLEDLDEQDAWAAAFQTLLASAEFRYIE